MSQDPPVGPSSTDDSETIGGYLTTADETPLPVWWDNDPDTGDSISSGDNSRHVYDGYEPLTTGLPCDGVKARVVVNSSGDSLDIEYYDGSSWQVAGSQGATLSSGQVVTFTFAETDVEKFGASKTGNNSTAEVQWIQPHTPSVGRHSHTL